MRIATRCGTCRVRKIKCDRARPACSRCLSTGRVCEGYGVWGGGNNPFGHQQLTARGRRLPIPRSVAHVVVASLAPEEQACAEWFVHHTATWMSGAFASAFWHTLVLQANSHEPAVLHATAALAAVEKRKFLASGPPPKAKQDLDDEERFVLCQYNKAIQHVRPLLSSGDRASARVVAIACMLFTCLEFIRCRYTAGCTHLSNGLRLLEGMDAREGSYEDDWLYEVFFTLTVHSALLSHSVPHPHVQHPPPLVASPSLARYESVSQARQHLDRLLSATHSLAARCLAARCLHRQDTRPSADLLLCQRRICEGLRTWEAGYRVLKARTFGAFDQVAQRDHKALRLLSVHHTLATVLSATCLCGEDESVFDRHTQSFVRLMRQAVKLVELVSPQKVSKTPAYMGVDRWQFSADMGLIPPLFYTALKCRVLHVRMQAIKLLRVLDHQEGIWDAALAAAMAEEVVGYESRGAQHESVTDAHGFLPESEWPQTVMPGRFWVQQVDIVLPDESMGNVRMACRCQKDDGSQDSFEREFAYTSGKGYVAMQGGKNGDLSPPLQPDIL
ncbi:hypothetical protein BS50DRAFT_258136 [Corynespora cassiicola Philippines]|uniref:Zn(2)-C6 fungal-type domain-containing protein n=1 Tax=Corynespora cassiicola Philippines TaxID=1448308 RepID=A0A2T2N2Q7_CORCC|nr:hypothetical protein BS50DRAFT_258136 [Corynespora cassiicola Philippines]